MPPACCPKAAPCALGAARLPRLARQQGQLASRLLAFHIARHVAWKVWPQRVVVEGSPSRGTAAMEPMQMAHSEFPDRGPKLGRVLMRRRVQSTWLSLVSLKRS